jgi:hypothetical protein
MDLSSIVHDGDGPLAFFTAFFASLRSSYLACNACSLSPSLSLSLELCRRSGLSTQIRSRQFHVVVFSKSGMDLLPPPLSSSGYLSTDHDMTQCLPLCDGWIILLLLASVLHQDIILIFLYGYACILFFYFFFYFFILYLYFFYLI